MRLSQTYRTKQSDFSATAGIKEYSRLCVVVMIVTKHVRLEAVPNAPQLANLQSKQPKITPSKLFQRAYPTIWKMSLEIEPVEVSLATPIPKAPDALQALHHVLASVHSYRVWQGPYQVAKVKLLGCLLRLYTHISIQAVISCLSFHQRETGLRRPRVTLSSAAL